MDYFIFGLTACLWGGSFIAIQPLVQAMPPLMAGTLRLAVAIAFLLLISPLLKTTFTIPKSLRGRIWLTGLAAFAVPLALLFWGEKSISPGLAGIINGTVPIWVFVIGLVFTPKAEPVTLRKIVGLFAGIAGVITIFLPKVLDSRADPSLWGTLAVVFMAISYATGALMNRTLFKKDPGLNPFANLFHQLVAGFFGLALFTLSFEGLSDPATWLPVRTVVLAELYLGCVSTSIAFLLFYHLIKRWGSVRAATVTYVIPAVALGLDLLINSHLPTASEGLGVVGVTAGVVILNFNIKGSTA